MALLYDVFSSAAFVSLVEKYSTRLPQPDNIFQTASGKCSTIKKAETEISGIPDIFQTAFGKSMPLPLLALSYSNLVLIAAHASDPQEALFYVVYSVRERLNYKQLQRCLAQNAYYSLLGGDKKNYSKKLKEFYPTAPVVIKDQAFLDYLSLPEKHKEPKLRREIVAHIRDFILEMGKDFLFVDQEYVLPVGGEDFKADLLFYHRGLQCLVAFELKLKKFHPKDLGQLEFYLEALDRDVKKENENPSIGVILCKSANKIVVEYAMSRTMSPVMVAQYKREFIPKEVLQRTFEDYLSLPAVMTDE